MENKPQKVKRILLDNQYMLGLGKVAISVQKNKVTEIPSISVSKISKSFKVGENIMNIETEESETILLSFRNLEGLKVMEEAIKHVKGILKEQNKLLKQ